MFKKLAADALGLSDIGVVVGPADYDKVDADDYLFHEDKEKIFFLIKSKKDEYCFTNLALVHVDGDSAVSTKRSIKRYPWSTSLVREVAIETAGTVDLDVELKFVVDDVKFSIDVRKNFIEQLKDVYKALTSIGRFRPAIMLEVNERAEAGTPDGKGVFEILEPFGYAIFKTFEHDAYRMTRVDRYDGPADYVFVPEARAQLLAE